MTTKTTRGGTPAKSNPVVTVLTYIGLLAFSAVAWAGIWWGSRATVDSQIIRDAHRQWAIVSKGDDAMAKSIHAGVLAQAYLMAGREKEYTEWKTVADGWQRVALRGGK